MIRGLSNRARLPEEVTCKLSHERWGGIIHQVEGQSEKLLSRQRVGLGWEGHIFPTARHLWHQCGKKCIRKKERADLVGLTGTVVQELHQKMIGGILHEMMLFTQHGMKLTGGRSQTQRSIYRARTLIRHSRIKFPKNELAGGDRLRNSGYSGDY